MSMNAPPHQPSLPLRRSLLQEEWQHWVDMPPLTFALLVLPSMLLLAISPLLPIAAYALQLWASSSFAWRDRWASTWVWAKQGGVVVALLFALSWLSAAHVWLFPALAAALQVFWHAHLPGDLSLSPLDLGSFAARTLLLLPLAPAWALLYEWIDPHTQVQPQRILTPADLVEPTPKAAPQSVSPPPAAPTKPAQTAHVQVTAHKRKRTQKPPQQMTIESFLAPPSAQAAPPPPSAEGEQQTRPPEPPPAQAHPPTVPAEIDWDDVAE
jgi:hypothetical protein